MPLDWYFWREDGTGRTTLVHREPSSMSPPTAGHRHIVGEELIAGTGEPNLVFRSVRGEATCADLALRNANSLPLPQLRSFLEAENGLAVHRTQYQPNEGWSMFRCRMDTGELDSVTAARNIVLDLFGPQPDRRLGTASLVASRSDKGIEALVTSMTEMSGSAGRVVGELLEISCLNTLYKPASHDVLARAARNLIDLVVNPDDIRRTWTSHLTRTLELNPAQWKAQVAAIDLAEVMLGDFWDAPPAGSASQPRKTTMSGGAP
jgi:hypothetical protein